MSSPAANRRFVPPSLMRQRIPRLMFQVRVFRRFVWILVLAGFQSFAAGVPEGRALPDPIGRPAGGFTRLPAPTTGIRFTNVLDDYASITNRNLLSGSGVAAADVDGDGRCDLYFSGIGGPGRLYRNLGGFKFEDVTDQAGVACAGQHSTGAAWADTDGDGDPDLWVNSFGRGTRLFRNEGQFRFVEVTDAAGIRSRGGSTSLAIADVEDDGDLDVYVAHFRPDTILDQPTAKYQYRIENGRPVITGVNGRSTSEPDLTNRFEMSPTGSVMEFGQADVLWINDGRGVFRAASWTDGTFLDEDGRTLVAAPVDWGLACRFSDVNQDGRPDLYVCNDLHTPDRFWINETSGGRIRFRAIGRTALRNNSTFSMGVDFADVNGDGYLDFFTVDMYSRNRAWRQTQMGGASPQLRRPGMFDDRVQVRRNALQLQRGDMTFAETAWMSGVESSEWSWGPIFLDVDLDGHPDLLITNGQLRDFQDSDGAARVEALQRAGGSLGRDAIPTLVRSLPRLDTANLAFRNRGDGTFEDRSGEWGFADRGISQGMALADLDGDGDPDVVMNNLMDAPGIYRNDASGSRLSLRVRGPGDNRHGIGARLVVDSGGKKQLQEITGGGRYLSGDEPMRTFGVATGSKADVSVHLGSRSWHWKGLVPGREYLLNLQVAPAAPPIASTTESLFEDVSERLAHIHADEPFEDFQRQILLPRALSQLGPGIAWTDVDGDQREDLVIGSGRGGTLSILRNLPDGRFEAWSNRATAKTVGRDLSGIIASGSTILAGSANYEDGRTNGGLLRVFDLQRGVSGDSVLGPKFSAGPLAMADADGDGTPDLFVGGRTVAGRYPMPAESILLKNSGGRFTIMHRWEGLGMVSGAVFVDIDDDRDPDLVVALELGPVRVFRNNHGQFTDVTRALGIEEYRGCWNGVAAGDFDGDGRMDWVAGNLGWNTRMHASTAAPWKVFAFDDGQGHIEPIEVESVGGRDWPVREYPNLAMILGGFRETFPTFASFASTSWPEVAGPGRADLPAWNVTWLASSLFLNRGDRVEVKALPSEAQRSPVFGICVGDGNGDGFEDIFLAGNLFGMHPMEFRADAGRGLWLWGDGHAGFRADEMTGIAVYGEGRGAALADFDQDGRLDVAVAQNSASTKLFRNRGAPPGLRIQVNGTTENPLSLGSRIYLKRSIGMTTVREIRAGSGYWSQDGWVQILGNVRDGDGLEVVWPDGLKRTWKLPSSKGFFRASRD